MGKGLVISVFERVVWRLRRREVLKRTGEEMGEEDWGWVEKGRWKGLSYGGFCM